MTKALTFKVLAECNSTRGRIGFLTLKQGFGHGSVQIETPIFMPVGTNGTMKGILPEQIEETGCRLMLSNTYHLAIRPGADIVEAGGGLHNFMRWPNALLTDSGGFQMVSLSDLTKVNEEGVSFTSPYDAKMLHLTPEKCIAIQHQIGANIIMQLDDVISSTATDQKRFEEATERTVRWYDRCKEAHKEKENSQNLFPIIQGGLDADLRRKCAEEIVARDPPGIAIGGLSGGEEKVQFMEMVSCSTENLPAEKPRYLMGVGFAVDIILSTALGCDMFDCVYPTRTARFGVALVEFGTQLDLSRTAFEYDFDKIDDTCDCSVCRAGYTRSYIHHLFRSANITKGTVGAQLLTQHNIRFQLRLMAKIRASIRTGTFVDLIYQTIDSNFSSEENIPDWVHRALKILKIERSRPETQPNIS